MQIQIDTHTHTIASDHAYSTVLENARAASEKGLAMLAITDHAPALPDAPRELHFMNYHVLEKILCGVEMLYGAELNILDYYGVLDLHEGIWKLQDVCIASFHDLLLTPGSKKENTRAMLGAMQNPYVAILGHPDDGKIPVDFEALVLEAKKANVFLEVNNSSLRSAYYRQNTRENLIEMLKLCEKHGTMISLGSDAHCAGSVGEFSQVILLLDEIGFPPELVANTSAQEFKKRLDGKK